MSGIVAVFDRRRPVDPERVDSLLATQAYRGHDGAARYLDDHVALGQQHFYTTPESEGERLPRQYEDTVLAFDGRVDNRNELAGRLSIGGPGGYSDAELVVRAYAALGDDFLDAIVGVFGLALWDRERGMLLVARDKTGVRRLYHATVDGVTVVASDVASVLSHPAVPHTVDEGFVGEYLGGQVLTPTGTPYAAVERVEPGTCCRVTQDGVERRRYWDPTRRQLPDDENALVGELAGLLSRAVACRRRGAQSPATLMSGGLDSTTLACLADEQSPPGHRPVGVSMVFDDHVDATFAAEIDRINTIETETGVAVERVLIDDAWPFESDGRALPNLVEGPCLNPMASATRRAYERIGSLGHRVAMTGEGGNIHDGDRLEYVDLVRQRKFGRLTRAFVRDTAAVPVLAFWYALVPTVASAVPQIGSGSSVPAVDPPAWLADDFVSRTDLVGRLGIDPVPYEFENAAAADVYENYVGGSGEFYRDNSIRTALRHGIELRSPLDDARVVEFVLAMPPGTRFHEGTDKWTFRQAIRGTVPETVRTHEGGPSFDPLIDRGLAREERAIRETLSNTILADRGIVTADALDRVVDSYYAGQRPEEGRHELWRLLTTEQWLASLEE